MFKTNKIDSTIKPEKFEDLNNGIWYYNFDVETEVVTEPTIEDETSQEVTKYRYSQVRITGKPTVSKCYEAVLKAYANEEGTTLVDALASPARTVGTQQLAEDLYEQIEIDLGFREPLTELEKAKRDKIKAIDEYDVSPEVNSFYLNGLQVWLDKSTRVGLMNSLSIEKAAGKETSTLWFGNIKLDVNTEAAIQMLSALELYALSCYNKTAEHKSNVEILALPEDVEAYDYTEGYPEKLNLTV